MFLDCVWQLLEQYPAAFEFSEVYLTILHDSARISLFGTFLFNCPHQRVKESTVSRRGCPACPGDCSLPPWKEQHPSLMLLCVLQMVTLWGKTLRSPGEYNHDFQVTCAETVTIQEESLLNFCVFFPRKM